MTHDLIRRNQEILSISSAITDELNDSADEQSLNDIDLDNCTNSINSSDPPEINSNIKEDNGSIEKFLPETLTTLPPIKKEKNNFMRKMSYTIGRQTQPPGTAMIKNGMNQIMPVVDQNLIQQVQEHYRAKSFQIIWKNVSYCVRIRQPGSFHSKLRQILNNLSGCFSSGQVTAIMGPSGAGKSTFLEILACRKQDGLTGSIRVKGLAKVRIAYVPQDNYLMTKLTVYETLRYACRLNYSTAPEVNYSKVEKLIDLFGLENIRNTFIARCSGGQQKRVSIALELFSKPNMLILDEPTTGLDSSSCSLVIKILKQLAGNIRYPMAIIATIHQPSWSVFTEFHNVYIISKRGENLYLGSPEALLPLLERINLPCDKYNSPPDYVIEIAAEDYGTRPIKLIQSEYPELPVDDREFESFPSLDEARIIRATPLMKSIGILLSRGLLVYRRNALISILRIVAIIQLTMFLAAIFGPDIGKSSGCPKHKWELYSIPLERLSNMFEDEILTVTQNNCCLFFGLIVGLISGMTSTVLEFPHQMHIFMKEYNNGWYSCISFYITKTIIDLPMQIIIPAIYILYIYDYTNQPPQYYREAYLLLITLLVSVVSESMGAAVSAIFMNDPTTAAFAAGAIPMPMILFGGFLVKYDRMPVYMKAASWLSLMKYAFEAMVITVYGFHRCEFDYQQFLEKIGNLSSLEKPTWASYLPLMISTMNGDQENSQELDNATRGMDEEDKAIYMLYTTAFAAISTDQSKSPGKSNPPHQQSQLMSFDQSVILSYYGINSDDIFYRSIWAMTIYFVLFKIITYYVILNKLKHGP